MKQFIKKYLPFLNNDYELISIIRFNLETENKVFEDGIKVIYQNASNGEIRCKHFKDVAHTTPPEVFQKWVQNRWR